MATNESNALSGKHVVVQNAVFGGTGVLTAVGPSAPSTTIALSTVVPGDGAELKECTFRVTTTGAHTTSGTHEWSISDGTNALATMVSTDAETVAGTLITLVLGSATNGKNIATTAGSRLILTNTELGTVTTGLAGIFRLVWGL